jgi:hypothetical protein
MTAREQREAMLAAWESRGTPCVDALEILEFGWLAALRYAARKNQPTITHKYSPSLTPPPNATNYERS